MELIRSEPIMLVVTLKDFMPSCPVIDLIWAANERVQTLLARRLIGRVVGGVRCIRSGALIQGKQEYEIREPVALAI